MINHSSKASSGMSDLFIDYSRNFTVRRAKNRSKTKGSNRTKEND